jgi:hypothetical protein
MTEKLREQKTTLREQLIEWVTDYKDVASRNALAETPKESADYLLSLMLKAVEGIENPYDRTRNMAEWFGFESCVRAVKKILGKV